MPITKDTLRNMKQETGATAFFETGLLGGETFGHALRLGFEKVCSIEIRQEFVDRGIANYSWWIQTRAGKIIADDSANIGNYIDFIEDRKCIFWLDAHLDSGLETAVKRPLTTCPLRQELEGIKTAKRKDHVIMVDDLRILTDQRYEPWKNDVLGLTSENFAIDTIKDMILEINKEYQFKTIDGHLLPFTGDPKSILKDDILVAYVP